MRVLVCATLLFVCMVVIPSVQCDRKYKVTQYDERNKRDTKERYTKNKKNKFDSDEDVSESKPYKRIRRPVDDDEEEEAPKKIVSKNKNNKEKGKKIQSRKVQESEEDSTDETEEVDVSVCVDTRGRRCDSDDATDETNEDYTDEDESDYVPKKKVIYIKKFAHEKKKSKPDKETGNILKIHRRGGARRVVLDDESSEEVGLPKRRRFTLEEDEE